MGHYENITELARALHFGHKSADGNHLSLLEDVGTYMEQNFILGQEFESFSHKGPVIESGINTLNSHLTLRLNFNTTLRLSYVANVQNGNYEACSLKVFCLYDTFRSITPGTGIIRTVTSVLSVF